MLSGLACEFMPANRAHRRAFIRLLLGSLLQKFALQTLRLSQNLLFQISHGLVTGLNAARQASRQTRRPICGKRLETAVGLRNRVQAAVAHALSYTTLRKKLPPQKLSCAHLAVAPKCAIDSRE